MGKRADTYNVCMGKGRYSYVLERVETGKLRAFVYCMEKGNIKAMIAPVELTKLQDSTRTRCYKPAWEMGWCEGGGGASS